MWEGGGGKKTLLVANIFSNQEKFYNNENYKHFSSTSLFISGVMSFFQIDDTNEVNQIFLFVCF